MSLLNGASVSGCKDELDHREEKIRREDNTSALSLKKVNINTLHGERGRTHCTGRRAVGMRYILCLECCHFPNLFPLNQEAKLEDVILKITPFPQWHCSVSPS